MFFFLAVNLRGVEVPAAVALGGVDELAAVGVEVDGAFLLGGVGDAAGGLVVDGGDEDFATGDEGDFLSIRGGDHFGDGFGHGDHAAVDLGIVADGDVELPGLGGNVVLEVEAAMEAVGELAFIRAGEEADGVLVEGGDFFGLAVLFEGALPDVEGAALFREVEVILVIDPDGVAVLAGEVGELAVGVFCEVVEPEVTGDGGLVVLTPVVLVAFAIMVEEVCAVG